MNSHLDRLRQELERATEGLTEEALNRDAAGKWTAAQVLEHLYLTYKNTNKAIARCLATGTPLVTSATVKHRFGKMLVLGLGYLPAGANAPERVVPRGAPSTEVRASIFTELQSMDTGLDDCERRFGADAQIIDHPLLGPFSADEWRRFHWVHGRHHVRQIRERAGK
jgi:DinB superfamily